ncbi:MAG TPA: 2Fe-2S iron-sulfur cluster-binding protein [Alphaproteobacteria bacterium]|nr:ferredoxin [Rhodospirillaceae bacterium]HRJ13233.1 2Fe-2S iron-sulfur cluster-binding protein [Alphaproteobacteria bacterium]
MKLIVTDPGGQTHTLEATPGWRVMEVIKEAGLPMRADCGGCTACATCHVYVDDAWLGKLKPANEEECDLLADSYVQKPNSRLACQITMTKELDGLPVTISEDAT